MSAPRFDWPGLMRAGLHGLGLKPAEFWALTPVELMVMLGREGVPAQGFTRARLESLLARYPDTGQEEGKTDDAMGRSAGAAQPARSAAGCDERAGGGLRFRTRRAGAQPSVHLPRG